MQNETRFHPMGRSEMLDAVERAFEERQFKIYYQPQYNHSNKRLVGAEALVRWIHPEYGIQSPGDFIPLFESNGLITRLDLYVFEELCAFVASCLEKGLTVVPVSFNVSRHDVFCPDFIDNMEGIRKRYNVPVKYLRVEITESAAVEGNDYLARILDIFHSLGYIVEMDDFGSGYSSLNVLKDIKVDIIKLDMIFLKGEISGRGGIIISSIVRMANWLETPIIVEGVETVEQADYMKSIGCEYIQGYLYSKPVVAEDFEKFLETGKSTETKPAMKIMDGIDAERFWSPDTVETFVFNNFVGGAAIFSYDKTHDSIEILRVNEKYIKELGMNTTQREVILSLKSLGLDEENRRIYVDTIMRAIESGEEETCETWRKIHSECCGDDELCIRTFIRIIGKSKGLYLFHATIRNITKEKNISDNEKKLRQAVDHANIFCWEYDVDTKNMYPCSRCRRELGMPTVVKNYPEPVIESGLFPADFADMYRDWHKQLDNGAKSFEAIIPLTADRIPFHVRYTAEFDENGRPYKAYGSATLVVDGEK